MRITDIEVNNYKAFYGFYHIGLDKDGKNLMIYGENGSGKSSLFHALKHFFRSSVQKVDMDENIFIPDSQKGTAYINVTVKESPESSKSTKYELTSLDNEIVSADKIIISDANKIKGFFDYKSLLKTHFIHKNRVNLFDILIEDVFPHAINEFTTREFGFEWTEIEHRTNNWVQGKRVVERIKNHLEGFNNGIKALLEKIEEDTNEFMRYFEGNIKVSLDFKGIEYHGRRDLRKKEIYVKVKYNDKSLKSHQFFLNEAKLSALAICLYLATVKSNPNEGKLKILVFDDMLIGLDMSNRLPFLNIIQNHFDRHYQIIMTTYDRMWYQLVRNYFGINKWKYVEFYTDRLRDEDVEIPIIKADDGYLERSKYYLMQKDYKASAVYLRSEFERIVKIICGKKQLSVPYKKSRKEIKSDDYWNSIVKQTNINYSLVHDIEIHRGTVMNPFSHDDTESPEFQKELIDAIIAVEKLKEVEIRTLKKFTFDYMSQRIKVLDGINYKQSKIISYLRNRNNIE